MSSKTETSIWAPLQGAVAQARTLDRRARKIAQQTADELYSRSETLFTEAQKRSARTVKAVRKNVAAALETIDSRTRRLSDVPDWAWQQLEGARKQLSDAEIQLRKGVEVVARGLHVALDKDVDGLRRKLSHLEKRVNELSGESKAA
ncbi:MAG: hypothetical protein FJ148_03520 [Deltaproteobacteria bacterium]|nr:hypothetical protein [Deltaproteobacteria bacterium]